MTDSAAAEALEMSSDVNVDAMTSQQAATKLAELGQQTQWRNKLLSGDGRTTKLFQQLTEKRSQDATATSLINAAQDPNAPQPFAGGANKGGMSRADEILAARWHLESGASLAELAEWEVGAAYVPPEDFRILEQQFNLQCLSNPQWVQKLLSGDPQARLTLDRWKRIVVASQPLPPVPTTGIAR